VDTFPVKDSAERKPYTFTLSDFTTEIITGVQFEIEIRYPTGIVDSTPLVQDGICLIVGNSFIQHFKNGTNGVTYHVRAVISTDLGNTYVGSALLPVARK
jgi:hypothetical protein